jgi:hypothetical protein
MPVNYGELSEQLTNWWSTQTDFQTKKELAGFLKVHPDTLGDYFSGRKFPRSDIADRLGNLTNIKCLKPEAGNYSPDEVVPPEPPIVTALTEGPQEPSMTKTAGDLQDEPYPEKSQEVTAGQPPLELPQKGGRYGERSVVISLQRTKCPFCECDIVRFGGCTYCEQHFVWANVPLENSELV